MTMGDSDDEDKKKKGGNSLRDLQKSQLDKLMANPDKPVPIPEGSEEWKPKEPPEFVRFYMGSSAGAGSEVFHVYRHLRRRENIRQQYIQENAVKDDLELEFQETLAKHRIEDEARTAKKRAKRLKKKQRQQAKKKSVGTKETQSTEQQGQGQDNATGADSSHSEEEPEEAHFIIGGR